MDLIDTPPKFNINDNTWSIYSRNTALAPQYVGKNARIKDSTVTQGCVIYGDVIHSVIFSNVKIGENSKVIDSVVMPGAKIGKNTVINKAVIGPDAVIGDGVVIGAESDGENKYKSKLCTDGLVLIEGGTLVPDSTVVPKCSMVEAE